MRRLVGVYCTVLIFAVAGLREAVGQRFIYTPAPNPHPVYIAPPVPTTPRQGPNFRTQSTPSPKAVSRPPTAPSGPPPPPPTTSSSSGPDDDDKHHGHHHGDVGENPCRDKEIECGGVFPPKTAVRPMELPPPAKPKKSSAKASSPQ